MGFFERNRLRTKLFETLKEYDALYSDEQEWEAAKKKVEAKLDDAFDLIGNDEYEDAEQTLADLITDLKEWHKELWRRVK